MTFLSFLISGISLGSIYAIIALGYTMVYGIAKMLNFAHGDVIMVGAYVSFYVLEAMVIGWTIDEWPPKFTLFTKILQRIQDLNGYTLNWR